MSWLSNFYRGTDKVFGGYLPGGHDPDDVTWRDSVGQIGDVAKTVAPAAMLIPGVGAGITGGIGALGGALGTLDDEDGSSLGKALKHSLGYGAANYGVGKLAGGAIQGLGRSIGGVGQAAGAAQSAPNIFANQGIGMAAGASGPSGLGMSAGASGLSSGLGMAPPAPLLGVGSGAGAAAGKGSALKNLMQFGGNGGGGGGQSFMSELGGLPLTDKLALGAGIGDAAGGFAAGRAEDRQWEEGREERELYNQLLQQRIQEAEDEKKRRAAMAPYAAALMQSLMGKLNLQPAGSQ